MIRPATRDGPPSPRRLRGFANREPMAPSVTETLLRLQSNCALSLISSDFPEVHIVQWCAGSTDVLYVTAQSPNQLGDVVRALSAGCLTKAIIQDDCSALIMAPLESFIGCHAVVQLADKCRIWLVPPTHVQAGWATYRVVSTDPKDLHAFVAEMRHEGQVDVRSHRWNHGLGFLEAPGFPTSAITAGLTERQVRALVLAHENGLLSSPARQNLSSVANREKVARSTYGEHLRRGLERMVAQAYPSLKSRDPGPKPLEAPTEPGSGGLDGNRGDACQLETNHHKTKTVADPTPD